MNAYALAPAPGAGGRTACSVEPWRRAEIVPDPAERGAAPVVLLADAHEDSRTVCAMLLRHAGVGVLEADTGEETIRLAHACRPDVVVLGPVLRGVDGLRALDVLKQHPTTARIPVVVISSVCGDEHEARARAAGCAAYLLKPCTPLRVLELVRVLSGVGRAA